MRITTNKPISGVQGKGAKRQTAAGTNQFTPEFGEESVRSAQTGGGASTIQGMDALLALQEVDERSERRRKASKHGHSLLDTLENVKTDLLGGQVSEDRLELLARQVAQRPPSGDPKIDSVLDEIELRVKVELAKLGRFPD